MTRPQDHARLRQGAVAAGVALSAAYLVAPSRWTTLRELVLYPAVEFGAGAAVLVGVRLYRPASPAAWRLIAAGVLAYGVGDLIWGGWEAGGSRPAYPASADFWYLAGYPLIGAGLVLAVRRRAALSERALTLDTAGIVCVGMLLLWVHIVHPALEGASFGESLAAVAYPIGDVILFAMTLRLALGDQLRSTSLRLLVFGLGFQLVADMLYTGSGQVDSRFNSAFWLAGLLCVGAAALEPSMRDLTELNAERVWLSARARLVLLLAVALVPSAVLAVQELRGHELPVWAIVITSVAILGLIALRVGGLVREAERAAHQERVLGEYSADLLAETSESGLIGIADTTMVKLLSPAHAGAVEHPNVAPHTLSVAVDVEGQSAAEVYADVLPEQEEQARRQLAAIASQLSLALTRVRLSERERANAASLLEQNDHLRELDEVKNRFVSSASHELRTPLASIVGYLEILLGGEPGELSEEQEEFLRIIDRNCARLNKLVDDILFMGRVDSARLTLEPMSVDVVALAADEVESMRAAAQSRQVQLRLDAPDPVPSLEADPTRLTQLLDNLVSNAVKFTREGGIVTVAVHADAGAIEIAVTDSGVGIPADELPRIFERFFRASTAATASAPGTGIGLSIVEAIAEAHGGTIDVQSELGAGTTFTVSLPLSPGSETLIAKAVHEHAGAAT